MEKSGYFPQKKEIFQQFSQRTKNFKEKKGSLKLLPLTFNIKVSKNLFRLILIWGMIVFLGSCATRPIAISTTTSFEFVDPDLKILILQPLLRFERTVDESPLPISKNERETFKAKLISEARNTLIARKFSMDNQEILRNLNMDEWCNQLSSISYRLVQGIISSETKELLNQLASIDERCAILVQFMKVKVGPGGYWNPNTGAIASSLSSSQIQTALISCSTGEVIWKNQVLLRKLPLPHSPQFIESLNLLYQNFIKKKEK